MFSGSCLTGRGGLRSLRQIPHCIRNDKAEALRWFSVKEIRKIRNDCLSFQSRLGWERKSAKGKIVAVKIYG
jgi:hypothetical protein